LEDPVEILRKMMEKTGGHLGKLHDLGLGDRSIKLAEALAPMYQDEMKTARGDKTKAGAAFAKKVRDVTEANFAQADVDENLKRVLATNAERFDAAFVRVKEIVETKLTPYLDKLADKISDPRFQQGLEKLIDELAAAVAWLGEHPWIGLGGVIAGAITKDIAG